MSSASWPLPVIQLDLAGCGDRKCLVRLRDGKIADMVAEEILVLGKIQRQGIDLQTMTQTLLGGKIARSQVSQVVALG